MGEFEKNQDAGGDKRTEEEIIAEKLRNAGQEQQGGEKDAQYGGKEDYSEDQGGGEKPQG